MNDFDATKRFLESLPEVGQEEEFAFACHPEVPCFNACCSDLTLMLTPYDVLRLRKHLQISSNEFFTDHGEMHMAPDTGLPLCHLRMCDDSRKSCPFVRKEGCSVYPDRPAACRTYPLGRATRPGENGSIQERFFLVREPHCQGFAQKKTWTPKTWLKDQGLKPYNAANDRYMRFLAKVKGLGTPVSTKQANVAALALFQLDNFQHFLQDSHLLEAFEIEDAQRARIFKEEEQRLFFALDWLELILLKHSETLRPLHA